MTRRMKPEPGLLALLERILANRPALPAAACAGRPEPFDTLIDHNATVGHHGTVTTTPTYRAALTEAAGICRRCRETACPDRITADMEKTA